MRQTLGIRRRCDLADGGRARGFAKVTLAGRLCVFGFQSSTHILSSGMCPAHCGPSLAPGYMPTSATPEGQPRLADRAQHAAWLAGAGRPDFPAVAVLRVAAGATMRQACTAAGIDPDAPLVGIPAAAF